MNSVTGSAGMNATSWPTIRSWASAAPGMRPGRALPSATASSCSARTDAREIRLMWPPSGTNGSAIIRRYRDPAFGEKLVAIAAATDMAGAADAALDLDFDDSVDDADRIGRDRLERRQRQRTTRADVEVRAVPGADDDAAVLLEIALA